ncbi:IS66-like element accessory protein TnpA [Ramlibacter sp. AN1133]|uniref:IS66-like element accessory protein TnpA n=1 Tax=Ramlibacter sp. AN1133 TaxID=3133429 RepID=UPI0030C14D9A
MQDSGHTSDWHGERVERVKANGKRVFSSAFKAWLVAQAGLPGVSVAALAMRHEINANQLRRWMRLEHLAQPRGAPAVLPVVLAPQPCGVESTAATPQPAPSSHPIEIEVAGALVRVHHGTQPAQLRMVLQALRA